MKLEGATALVTGGAQRIGSVIAYALAKAGVRVVVHYNGSQQAAQLTCDGIRQQGGVAEAVQGDLSHPEQVMALVDRSRSLLGPLSILVNNAAIFEPGSIRDTSLANWQRHHQINATAPFLLLQAFARQPELMNGALDTAGEARSGLNLPLGKVINIIDRRVRRPGAGYIAYTTAKSALWSLTQLAAKELAPHIQVNAIGPGPILPPPGEGMAHLERVAQATPARRPGSPEEIASALIFLLEHDFITGEMLAVDGGEHL
ncbi:MAG: SDR family oxidoreductase [Magnetococcales bacterium]|nr:SDR family oxidoreductase [Magnetococcales bacterium]